MARGFSAPADIFLNRRGRKGHGVRPDHPASAAVGNRIPPWFTLLFLGRSSFAAVYRSDNVSEPRSLLMGGDTNGEAAAAIPARPSPSEGPSTRHSLHSHRCRLDSAGREQFRSTAVRSCPRSGSGRRHRPHLTDDYWIHGGGFETSIRPSRWGAGQSMISWQLVFYSETDPGDLQLRSEPATIRRRQRPRNRRRRSMLSSADTAGRRRRKGGK